MHLTLKIMPLLSRFQQYNIRTSLDKLVVRNCSDRQQKVYGPLLHLTWDYTLAKHGCQHGCIYGCKHRCENGENLDLNKGTNMDVNIGVMTSGVNMDVNMGGTWCKYGCTFGCKHVYKHV